MVGGRIPLAAVVVYVIASLLFSRTVWLVGVGDRALDRIEERRWRVVLTHLEPHERPVRSLYCSRVVIPDARETPRGFAFLSTGAVYLTIGEQPEAAPVVITLPFAAIRRIAPEGRKDLVLTTEDGEGRVDDIRLRAARKHSGREFLALLLHLYHQE